MSTIGEKRSQREGQSDQERIQRAEREIDSARSAITEDLHALGEKFSPEHLKGEAKELARSAAHSARESVSHTVERVEGKARRAATHTIEIAQQQAERAKQNPLAMTGAALLVGLGIGLLLPASEAGSRTSKATRAIKEQARGTLEVGQETARRLREGVQGAASEVKETLEEGTRDITRET